MQKIEPNTIEGFQRDFTGLLSPDGQFYYSGRFGHDDLGSALVSQVYGKEMYGLKVRDFLAKHNWFELRHTSDEVTISPYLGYTRLWDTTYSFNWPTPEQLKSLRQIESISGFQIKQLEPVDDIEWYLFELKRYEELAKEHNNKPTTIKQEPVEQTIKEAGLAWYHFWCCTPTETNPLLKEVILIRAVSQKLAQNYCNIIFSQTPSTFCNDCKNGNASQYPIESPEEYIKNNFNHWDFDRTIAMVDLPKHIYWSGRYADYASQMNKEGLEWQPLEM